MQKSKEERYNNYMFISFYLYLIIALGCITPPIPQHATLSYRTENKVKFLCDPSYVFPDTAVNSRELICTARHTWDNILPNCIGILTFYSLFLNVLCFILKK